MKVILLKNIGKWGKEWDTVDVKDGYACNYLIPQGIAIKMEKGNIKRIEELKRQRIKEIEGKMKNLQALKDHLGKISLTITTQVKNEEEIYGSITETQILKLLKDEEKIELEKGKIELSEPIKKVGVYNLKVHLNPDIEASLRLWIVKK